MKRIALSLAVAGLVAATGLAADEAPRTLTVTGTAQVAVEPDICYMTFVITTEHPKSAAEAYRENNRVMTAVRDAVTGQGIAQKDVQTQNFTIAPQYRWDDDRDENIFEGYQVSHSLFVKLRDIDKASAVLDAAVSAGATQVSGVSFTVENPKDYLAEARVEAIKAARAKAELIAQTAGVTLLRPMMISENEPGDWRVYHAQANVDLASTGWQGAGEASLEPGEVKLSHTVNITYEMK